MRPGRPSGYMVAWGASFGAGAAFLLSGVLTDSNALVLFAMLGFGLCMALSALDEERRP